MKLIPLPHRPNSVAAAVSAILSLAAASAAQAGPQDGVVTSGSATISTPAADLTQIDQASRVVNIDWRSFDLAADETVRFNQPSASAVALNRIQSQDPSLILGSISANGRVFLLNPNGIIFGESARVNVGSLVASSLELSGGDPASGRYSFSTSAEQGGAIVNNGRLTAADGGSITLLGRSVRNNGLIVANYGTVNLGAGSAATLNFDADGLVRLQIDAGLLGAGGAGAAVGNTGEISAMGGQVLLTARQAADAVSQAVNNSGVIRAARIDNTGGRIRLVGADGAVVNSGTLDASATDGHSTGGEVQVLGSSVELAGTARVDVSGSRGGGTALIGGSFGGADPSVLNADQTVVRAGAEIRADSTLSGDAGRVAVWADGTTRFSGTVYARADGADGNGGIVEVSGREHLAIDGHAWLQSRNGSAGSLLLDPGAVTIQHGTNNVTAENDVFTDGWIATQLAGSDLTISTANSNSTNPALDLTVAADVDLDWVDTTLSLIGGSSVTLQAGGQLTGTGTGSLVLQSGGGVTIDSAIALGGGLTVTAGGPIAQAGSLDVGGIAGFRTLNDTGAAITLDGTNNFGTVNASVRNAADTANAAATISIQEASSTTLGAVNTAGNLTVVSAGSIGQSGVLTVNGNSIFQAGNGASITLGDIANTFGGTLGFSSAGTLQDVTIADSTALDLQALTAANLTVTSGGAITQSDALNVTGTASFRTRNDTGAVITLDGTNNFGTVSASVRNAADTANADATITIREAGSTTLGTVNTAGNLNVVSAGAIGQSGALNVGGAASFRTLNDTGAAITLSGTNNFGTVNASVRNVADTTNANATITIREASSTVLGAVNTAGNLTVTSGGAITQSGALNVAGTAGFRTLNDGGAAITLDGTNNFGTVNASVRNAADTANANAGITIREASSTTLGTVNTLGNLGVVSTGSINQSGVLTVNGNATFQVGNGASITLGDIANTFGGTLGFSSTGALQDVTIADSTALDLQALSIAGNLTATSGGAITQSGALDVTGAARFRTRSDAGAAITLGLANNFGSVYAAIRNTADTANAAATITVNEASAMVLGDVDTAGAAALSSGGAITRVTGTDVTAASLSLTAGGDIGSAAIPLALAAANMTVAATSSGSIHLQNTGTIRLSGIQAGGTASISAGGSILDDATASTIVANTLVLDAAGSIGEATGTGNGPLEVQAQSVAANAQGGGVYLDATTGNLNLRQVSATGPVWLRAASGAITDDVVDPQAASVTSSTGGISLLARDNIGTVTDLAARQGSAIQVNSNGGQLNAQVTSTTGQINLLLGAGATPTFGTLSAGGAGRLLLQSPGSLSLGAMGGSVAGFTQVGFSADGVLTLPSAGLLGGSPDLLLLRGGTDIASAGRILNLSAGNLVYNSGGQGGATTLNTTVNRLDASLGNNANLTVNNSTALALGTVAAGGDLTIQAADLLDDGDAGSVTRVSAGGTLSLTSSAGIGRQEGSSGGRIDTAGGTLVLQAGAGSVFVSNNGNLQVRGAATGGSMDIAAPSGNITVNGPLSATGAVTLSAGSTGTAGNILLNGTVQAGQAANLSALGGGNISDADATVRLIAADANLQANNIGTATNALNATLTSLQATATTRLNVDLSGGAQLRAIAAPTVTISAVGNLVDDGNAQTRVVGQDVRLSGAAIGTAGSQIGTAAGSLSLNATGGGIYIQELDAVTLADVTAAGAGNDIVLLAGGAISDDGSATTRISGGNLTLAGTALGAQGGELQTQVAALTATTAGGLYISEVDDLQLNAITADRIRISAAGALTDDNNDSTRLTASTVTLIAQSVGTAGSRIDTAAGTLAINTGSAGAYVDELDNVTLAGVDVAGDGVFSLHASGAITDADATIVTAGRLDLSAASIGTAGNALDTAADSLTAGATAGGLFIDNAGNLVLDGLTATGPIGVRSSGALNQVGAVSSNGGAVGLRAGSITMQSGATTRSGSGNITYVADSGDVTLGVLDAGAGRTLVIARDGVYSGLARSSGLYNLAGSLIEVRAGGLGAAGQIGTADNPLEIDATGHGPRSVFLVMPAVNGVQTTTPQVNLAGASTSVLLLKGYTGTTGALLLDPSTAFTQDAVVQSGESIVPLLNGRAAVNTDSLGAASQALSSGVVARVDVDWSAFDPDVSLFSTVGPSVRVPDDQVDEAAGP